MIKFAGIDSFVGLTFANSGPGFDFDKNDLSSIAKNQIYFTVRSTKVGSKKTQTFILQKLFGSLFALLTEVWWIFGTGLF